MRSQRRIGNVSNPEQLVSPTPHPARSNHGTNSDRMRITAAAAPTSSDRRRSEVSMAASLYQPLAHAAATDAKRRRRRLEYVPAAMSPPPSKRWALTLPLTGVPLKDLEEHVRRAEAVGYTDLWSGETNGPDGFTPLSLAAAWTD